LTIKPTLITPLGERMTDKRPSAKVASDAGKTLQNPRSSKRDKELAASILANREPKKKGK